MPESSVVDIEDLVLNHARVVYDEQERPHLEKKFGKLPWDKVKYTVDRSKFFIHHETSSHTQDQGPGEHEPRHTVLFRSNYNNTTDGEMEYNISTERRTRTSMTCTLTRGFRLGASFELGVAPPGMEAKLGFSNELNFENSVCTSTEKEVSWRIDTRVRVPAHRNVVAELCVKEDEYKGKFSVTSHFTGKIYVDIYKDNTDLCRIIISNLRSVLTEKLGFTHDRNGAVLFKSEGLCHCRYGIEQDVHIKETPELKPVMNSH